MRQVRNLFLILCILPMAACGTILGGETPKTLNETKLALEYEYQGALATLEQMTDAGILDTADKARALSYVEQSETAIMQARQALDLGWDNQSGYISAANAATLQLIRFLESKKGDGA